MAITNHKEDSYCYNKALALIKMENYNEAIKSFEEGYKCNNFNYELILSYCRLLIYLEKFNNKVEKGLIQKLID